MYQLYFYVPEDSKEQVKQALFDIGIGKIGNYQNCCWETEGQGQFMPMKGANPFIGEAFTLETLKEFKVEMVVEFDLLQDAIQTLIAAHPYEEPAYGVIQINEHQD